MKIALILGTLIISPANYFIFLQEYINAFKNKDFQIDLFSSSPELFLSLNLPANINLYGYENNFKILIEKKYDIFHNFGDENFALIAPFICDKVINTSSHIPFLPQTNNFSVSKKAREQDSFFFIPWLPFSFSGKDAEIGKIVEEYENLYRSIKKTDEQVAKLNIVINASEAIRFNGDTPFLEALGGTESSVVYLSREFARAGHQVTVFSDCKVSKDFDGVLYDFPENFNKYSIGNNIDVLIVLRDFSIINNLKAKISIFWPHEDYDQKLSINFFENTFNGNMIDKIFAISNYQKANYIKYFNLSENKFYLTRNGINPDFNTKIKERKRFKLMYTSTPHKGLEVLARIFPKIKEKVPEAYLEIYSSLTIYGYTEDFDYKFYGNIYNLLNKTDGVTRKEITSHPELAEALSEAYLFVYPNTFPETFCISALESQAAGTPVITSELGALCETVEDKKTGICIPGRPESEEYQKQFIDSVVDLLTDSQKWQQYSSQARERAVKDFSWKMIAGEWLETFTELIKQYNILKNFFEIIQKIIKEQNLNNREKLIIFHLYEIMISAFDFTTLKGQQKEILSYFINNIELPENDRIKLMLDFADISFYLNETNAVQNYILAIKYFRKMNNELTNCSMALAYNKYVCYQEALNIDDGIKICTEGLMYYPEDFSLNFKLGELLMKQGRFIAAINSFRICTNLPNNNVYFREGAKKEFNYTFLSLANCYVGLKDYPRANHFINIFLKNDSGHNGAIMLSSDIRNKLAGL